MPQASKPPTRNFASDNNAGVHPEVLEAIRHANQGHVVAYGDDPYPRSALAKFEEQFGTGIDVFSDVSTIDGSPGNDTFIAGPGRYTIAGHAAKDLSSSF